MFSFTGINWLAVIVSGAAAMMIGFIWYGPLFGMAWKKANKFTEKDMKNMKITPKMAMSFGTINSFVMAIFLALIISALNSGSLVNGILVGLVLWVGIAVTTRVNSVIFEQRPLSLFIINAGYDLVTILVMGIILSVWK
jgi:mannitol-specific phosphotransferase system IIBC component